MEPQVRRCVTIAAEGHAIAEWLLGRCKARYELGQIAVLYCEHWIGVRFAQVFKKPGVRVDLAHENKNKVNIKRAAVRLLSMRTATGLEFPCGCGCGWARSGAEAWGGDGGLRAVGVCGSDGARQEVMLTYSQDSTVVAQASGMSSVGSPRVPGQGPSQPVTFCDRFRVTI